jgi:hypothetical protein
MNALANSQSGSSASTSSTATPRTAARHASPGTPARRSGPSASGSRRPARHPAHQLRDARAAADAPVRAALIERPRPPLPRPRRAPHLPRPPGGRRRPALSGASARRVARSCASAPPPRWPAAAPGKSSSAASPAGRVQDLRRHVEGRPHHRRDPASSHPPLRGRRPRPRSSPYADRCSTDGNLPGTTSLPARPARSWLESALGIRDDESGRFSPPAPAASRRPRGVAASSPLTQASTPTPAAPGPRAGRCSSATTARHPEAARSSPSASTSSSPRATRVYASLDPRRLNATSPSKPRSSPRRATARSSCCRSRSAVSAAKNTTPSGVTSEPTAFSTPGEPRTSSRSTTPITTSKPASCTSAARKPMAAGCTRPARPPPGELAGGPRRKAQGPRQLQTAAPPSVRRRTGWQGGRDRPDRAVHPRPFPLLPCAAASAYDPASAPTSASSRTLGSEGRSTATTILTLSVIRRLRARRARPERRKLLSFTDNRQDAALQAGHFNDFVGIGLVRSALSKRRPDAEPSGPPHDELTQRVFDALALPIGSTRRTPSVEYTMREETERALRRILGYHLYRDLRRGWRITSPNLEQCGLLTSTTATSARFAATRPAGGPATRRSPPLPRSARADLRDTSSINLRRELAIKVEYLDPVEQESIRSAGANTSSIPGASTTDGRLERAAIAVPGSSSGVGKPDRLAASYLLCHAAASACSSAAPSSRQRIQAQGRGHRLRSSPTSSRR